MKIILVLIMILFSACSKAKINDNIDTITGDVVRLIEDGIDHSKDENSTK